MRKLFALMLIALLLGVGIVAVIETDPGYVLVAYGNYTVETSLWIGIAVLAVFTLLIYAFVRLLRRLLSGQNSITSWLGSRRTKASSRLTTRGLISFIEGNWSRARRQLLRQAICYRITIFVSNCANDLCRASGRFRECCAMAR